MLIETLEKWVNINSGSGNPEGLGRMADVLQAYMEDIPGTLERTPLPPYENLDGSSQQPGDILSLRFNPEAPVRVLFSGHMDTVYSPENPFQTMSRLPDGRLHGPGVADMKGGLLILIESVRQFLQSDKTGRIGGEILINGDEETGSVGSRDRILEAARWSHLGLVFESSLPGGELVRCRKGSGTFRVIARGRPAHTGRDFENGRNAVVALADLMQACHALNGQLGETIVNVVNFLAPGPVNVVPERAECWLNVRIAHIDEMERFREALAGLIQQTMERREDVQIELEGDFQRAPKGETPGIAVLHELWNKAEESLGLPLSGKRDTGGSSDGNILSEVGMPHLDGVGIRGGAIHSADEFAFAETIETGISRTVNFLQLLAQQPDCLGEVTSAD
ncbi:MAG: hydrolase [Puniceicoccaceae bacterium]